MRRAEFMFISILGFSRWWSESSDTKTLHFGVVTLAGGSDEGLPYSMGSMRYAQGGNTGYLPNDRFPNTFIAQAYDIGDPCTDTSTFGFHQQGSNVCAYVYLRLHSGNS